MKCRDCCRREVYASLGVITLFLFEIVAIAAPWYAIAATKLPKPWDSLTAVFYWSGMEALYSPPLFDNTRSYNLNWSQMKTTMPKDVYMGSMALCFLALFGSIFQFATIFFGYICPGTSRMVQVMFCGFFKWIVCALCFAELALTILSWTIFFAFNAALSNANVCPGTTDYGAISPFPVTNGTMFVEPLWCDSFANSRLLVGVTDWVWAPSVGWVFGLLCTPIAFYVLCIMLTVDTGPAYESLGEASNIKMGRRDRDYRSTDDRSDRYGARGDMERDRDRDRDRERDRDRDRGRGRGDRGDRDGGRGRGRDDDRGRDPEDRKRDSRRYDDEKMQRKYDSFRV